MLGSPGRTAGLAASTVKRILFTSLTLQQNHKPTFLTFAGEGPSDHHSPLLEEAVLCAIVSVISTACSRLQPSSVHSQHVEFFLFHQILVIDLFSRKVTLLILFEPVKTVNLLNLNMIFF